MIIIASFWQLQQRLFLLFQRQLFYLWIGSLSPHDNHCFFLAASAAAFLAFSAATFLFVLEIKASIRRRPRTRAKAGTFSRYQGSMNKPLSMCFESIIGRLNSCHNV